MYTIVQQIISGGSPSRPTAEASITPLARFKERGMDAEWVGSTGPRMWPIMTENEKNGQKKGS